TCTPGVSSVTPAGPQGEDDLQDPAAHHADLLCLWNICSECDTELLSGRGEPEHHTGMDLHHQKGNDPSPPFPSIVKHMLIAKACSTSMKVLRSQSLRMNSLQDESSLTKMSSEKDEIRLHVSRLRTDDSGLYLCEVSTNYGVSYGECRLNVTVLHIYRGSRSSSTESTMSPTMFLQKPREDKLAPERPFTFSWEKMICRILLLITLTSCVCGTFVVNVTQSSYQAEENQNITLE
ncbi:hypothetical protein L3Q82_016642, partial [Scortum barcoo]